MEDFATRFADFLEEIAVKVRSLTVDRIARYVTMGALGIVVGTLGFTTLIFLLWAIFGALEIPLTTAGAFAVLGALFLVGGAIMWFMRTERE
jgi:putative flippase GtrA